MGDNDDKIANTMNQTIVTNSEFPAGSAEEGAVKSKKNYKRKFVWSCL